MKIKDIRMLQYYVSAAGKIRLPQQYKYVKNLNAYHNRQPSYSYIVEFVEWDKTGALVRRASCPLGQFAAWARRVAAISDLEYLEPF